MGGPPPHPSVLRKAPPPVPLHPPRLCSRLQAHGPSRKSEAGSRVSFFGCAEQIADEGCYLLGTGDLHFLGHRSTINRVRELFIGYEIAIYRARELFIGYQFLPNTSGFQEDFWGKHNIFPPPASPLFTPPLFSARARRRFHTGGQVRRLRSLSLPSSRPLSRAPLQQDPAPPACRHLCSSPLPPLLPSRGPPPTPYPHPVPFPANGGHRAPRSPM